MLWTPARRNTLLCSLKAGLLEASSFCDCYGRPNRMRFPFVGVLLARSRLRFFYGSSPRTEWISSLGRSSSCSTPTMAMVRPKTPPALLFDLSPYHCNLEKHACTSGSEETPLDLPFPDHAELDCVASFAAPLSSSNPLSYGRLLHAHLIKSGSNTQNLTELHLVPMYCKCGCLEDAYALFNAIHPRILSTTWNAMISSLIDDGRVAEAHWLFDQMLIEGILPNRVTLSSLLSTCTKGIDIFEGHQMHARVQISDLCADPIVGMALVAMYGRCGSLENARLTFDSMPSHDVVSWTALISIYIQYGQRKLALEVFFLMQQENVNPSKVILISILSVCTGKDDLHIGKELHASLRKNGFESDVVVSNALLSMYGKCGSVECARGVFDSMPQRNVVSWNAIIAAYAQNGEEREALCIAQCMQQETLPDDFSLVSTLNACASVAALCIGKQIHSCVIGSRLDGNMMLGNTLVNVYGKCGSLEEAFKVFETMRGHDVITWNALISAFVNGGQVEKAFKLFLDMQQEGLLPNRITFVSVFSACANQGTLAVAGKQIHSSIAGCEFELDVVVGTAIVNMYGKLHFVSCAREVFDKMPARNVVCWTAMISSYAWIGQTSEAFALFDKVEERHDPVLWNSIIVALSQNCQGKKALALFEQMLQEGVLPDRLTYVSCLDAASSEAVLGDGKCLHARIVGMPYEGQDTVTQNALVSMYGKCGSLKIASKHFEQLPKRDVFAWSSMIAAYAHEGLGREALHVFTRMQQEGVIPDKVTFVNVLSACSRAGLVQEGCVHFASMISDYAITPTEDHYNCMIDLLGRCGRLDEAEKLVLNMKVPLSVVSWLTLLSACRSNVDVKLGERAAESISKMDPNNVTPYILLSNIYTAASRERDLQDELRLIES